jgi:tetratricopeptide (TPR) repeat protein
MLDPHQARAELLYDQGRYEMAQQELEQVLAHDPDDVMGHALLALCLIEQKAYQKAGEAADRAIHLGPDEPFTHYVKARICLERNRYKEADESIRQAIAFNPYAAEFHALLSALHYNQSRWKEALTAAEKGLELEADNIQAANLRAMSLIKLGRREEAGKTLDATLAKNPENSYSHTAYGWTHMEESKPEEALEHFREALRLDPENVAARNGIVEALKARNPIYSCVLRYLLAMAKLPGRVQMGIVIGAVLLMNFLGGLERRNPEWQPWILPIQMIYLGFVLMTWTAIPFFNLLLRFNPIGRTALTEEQTREANVIGGLVIACLLCLAAYLLAGGPFLFFALILMLLVFPTASLFKCTSGWPRTVMLITAGILCAMAMAASVCFFKSHFPEPAPGGDWARMGDYLLGKFVIGAILSSWGGAFLASVPVKK